MLVDHGGIKHAGNAAQGIAQASQFACPGSLKRDDKLSGFARGMHARARNGVHRGGDRSDLRSDGVNHDAREMDFLFQESA